MITQEFLESLKGLSVQNAILKVKEHDLDFEVYPENTVMLTVAENNKINLFYKDNNIVEAVASDPSQVTEKDSNQIVS